MVDTLCERIGTGFGNPNKAEPALVVGIFGEWGSGKSTVLSGVARHLTAALPAAFKALDEADGKHAPAITVPIEFNAWRYEREAHLIVPLLKTAQSTLRKVFSEHRTLRDKANDWAEGVLDLLADVTLAVGKGLNWEFKLFDMLSVISGTPGEILNEYQKRRKARTDNAKTGIDHLDSLYVNFHSHFRALTGRDGKLFAEEMALLALRARQPTGLFHWLWHWIRPAPMPPAPKRPLLNLVFLIDDLDRCLPEKAVEMLEVIKLFLEVEGCAFMLAVDDEVIERGILHRYRDYLFQHNNGKAEDAQAPRNDNHHNAAPITGSEYLEKIIHLPIRLARPSKQLVREFLLQRYAQVFVPEKEITSKLLESVEATAKGGSDGPRTLERAIDSPLLPIFLELVPPVPRRLVRAVELFVTLREVAQRRGVASEIQPQFLAVLAIVQVCAPELFRYARRTRPQFIDDLHNWRSGKESVFNTDALIKMLQDHLRKERDEATPNIGSINEANDKLQLALLLEKGLNTRGGFDARKLATLTLPDKIDASAHLDLWADREVAAFTPVGELPMPTTPALAPAQDVVASGEVAAISLTPPTGHASVDADDDDVTPEPYPEPPRESAVLEDVSRFVQGLCAREPEAWRNALARESAALQNRVLDRNTFDQLLRLMDETRFAAQLGDEPLLEWLNLLAPHLDAQQALTLAQRVAVAGNSPSHAVRSS